MHRFGDLFSLLRVAVFMELSIPSEISLLFSQQVNTIVNFETEDIINCCLMQAVSLIS